MNELIPCHEFKFRNQSYAQIAQTYFQIKFGKLIFQSAYTEEQIKITDDFYTTPLIDTLIDNSYL